MYSITTATRKVASLSKKIRAVQGGTSASKTISILLVLIDLAQRDKQITLTSVVSESIPHLKRGALRDFKNILKAQGYWKENCWNSTDSIYTFESGSQIEFFSADNADKLRGGRRDRLFLNEANNLTLAAFDELEVRTREFVFLDWNPTNEFWFYTDVLGTREDVELIILTYKDNEALDKTIIESIENRKHRVGWYKVYGEGQLGEVEGKIYTGWQIIDGVPHEARLERFGLDFGYTNDPTAIVAVYYYNGGYIFDEVAFTKGLSNKQIFDILDNTEKKALVVADSSEPKSVADIRGYGANIVGVTKGHGSIKNGIQAVQDQQISVTKQSVNIIKEYRNYLWMVDKKTAKILNEPEEGYDHSMDAIRYAMSTLVKPTKKETEEKVVRTHVPASKYEGTVPVRQDDDDISEQDLAKM